MSTDDIAAQAFRCLVGRPQTAPSHGNILPPITMSAELPTPLTDAATFQATSEKPESAYYELLVVDVDFAKNLERKMYAVKAELAEDNAMHERRMLDKDLVIVAAKTRIAQLERDLATALSSAATFHREGLRQMAGWIEERQRKEKIAAELEALREHNRVLRDALEGMRAAEDASCDEFTAVQIDAIEAAMTKAKPALALTPESVGAESSFVREDNRALRDELERVSSVLSDEDQASIRALLESTPEQVGAEIAELRKIISDATEAIGNGSRISVDASLKFMAELPNEIRLHVGGLRQWKKEQLQVSAWWQEIDAFVRAHPDAPLGKIVAKTVLEWLRERDEMKALLAEVVMVTAFGGELLAKFYRYQTKPTPGRGRSIIDERFGRSEIEAALGGEALSTLDARRAAIDAARKAAP